ncbi:MAG: ATP-binding protein, partial [Planctomycetota bacterium]
FHRATLTDLGSSNGTVINGDPVTRHDLKSGDRIEIGSTLMIFTAGGRLTAMDAAHGVDIVQQVQAGDASQIVSSMARPAVVPRVSDSSPDSVPDAPIPGHAAAQPAVDSDRSLEVMYSTALAVGRTGDLDEVLDRVLRLVFDWVEADRGCIMLQDPESKRLTPAARCDRDGADSDTTPKGPSHGSERITISQTILDYVFRQKEGVRTSDAIDDSRFDSAASIVRGGVREAICVPLQGRYDIVGALYVDTYTTPGDLIRSGGVNRFHDEHLRLITAIGHQAALAIEDTFYYSALLQGERLAAMGQTIATLSHHIKNILQGVRGGGYLIEAGLDRDDTEAIRKGWAMVDRNQERISNLVLDMLTFSKERVPERTDSDLNATIADVIELMQTRAAEQSCVLSFQPDSDLPDAYIDPDAIHRAVLNLVTNAIDAATSLVEVTSTYDAVNGWVVHVSDDGDGIPESEREQVFSLFESKKGARGTGLGLPVSAKILREHGGLIEADDAAIGGACFRMVLPPTGTDLNELPDRQTQF